MCFSTARWNLNMGKKVRLCYMNTDSFQLHIKIEDIFVDIAKNVETRFNTSNYEIDRPWPKGINKKVIGLMKDKLRGKMLKLVALKLKAYSYLIDDKDKNKKAKGVIKRNLKFMDYKNCLKANQLKNELESANHKEFIKNTE